jgi:hypothetical protein
MRRYKVTTVGRVLLAAAALSSATIMAPGAAVAAAPRHATTGWGSPTSGHGSTFGMPAKAGLVSSKASMTAWTTDGDVKTSLIRDGVLYIGGSFTHLVPPNGGAPVAASHLAALSASTGQPIATFLPGVLDGAVDIMTSSADHTRIFVGGAFTSSGGTPAWHVMSIDPSNGARDPNWHGSTTWPVYSMAVAGSRVFVGGGYDHKIDTPTPTFLTALDATDGSVSAGFTPAAIDNEPYHTTASAITDGWITALAVSTDGARLYVGGYFNRVGGGTRPGLAALSTSTGGVLTTFAPHGLVGGSAHAGNDVLDLLATSKHLYVAVGGRANMAIDFDPWVGGNARFNNRTDGDVQSLALIGQMLYLGGHFHTFVTDATGYHYNGMTVRGYVVNVTFAVRVDATAGQLDTSWQPKMGDWQDPNAYFGTYTLSTDGHNLYAGGAFDKVNAVTHPHVAFFAGP